MNKLNLKIVKTPKGKNNELELFVEAPKEISEKAYAIALRDAANVVDIPGFRKGKAPKDIVEKKVGLGYISRKAFESIFYEILIEVANQEKLDIVDVLEIFSFELLPEKPLSFKVLVELKPEVKIGKYKGLKVKAKKIAYDKDIFIKKTLEKIANNLISFKKINDRSVKEGDQVTLDFEGKFEDGSEVPGGKAENFLALLEKDKFLPEFVDKLIGVKAGETKQILITFPENYAQGFSGRKAVFNVTVKGVEEKLIPEINDELAKKVGLENLKTLEDKIVAQMLELEMQLSQSELENKVVDHIIQDSKFEISERMIEKEIDFLLNDVKNQCQRDGVNWSDFKSDEKNKGLLDKAREAAIKRISIDLILSNVVKKEDITATDEEINNEVKNRLSQLGEKYKNLEQEKRFRNTVEMVILRNKAVDFLIKNNEAIWEKEETKIIPD